MVVYVIYNCNLGLYVVLLLACDSLGRHCPNFLSALHANGMDLSTIKRNDCFLVRHAPRLTQGRANKARTFMYV